MKKTALLFLAPILAGCLSTAKPPQVACWTIETTSAVSAAQAHPAEGEKRGVLRVAQLIVRAPYDVRTLVVLRADGSVAFDAYNQFAAVPSALLKNAATDALRTSGAFAAAVGSASSVRSDLSVEISVDRLALDCRTEESRVAVVALTLTLIRDREIYATVTGEGSANAADGDYTRAFSTAFLSAMNQAVSRL